MKTLADYIAGYGPEAGPKIYRVLKSRAAYKGVSTRRRHRIEALTGLSRSCSIWRRTRGARSRGSRSLKPIRDRPELSPPPAGLSQLSGSETQRQDAYFRSEASTKINKISALAKGCYFSLRKQTTWRTTGPQAPDCGGVGAG